MPYFTTEPLPDGDTSVLIDNLPSELVSLMNTRFDNEVEDIENQTDISEEDKQQQIEDLADSIRSDAEAATDEEIALLYYLHTEENDTEAWFNDLDYRAGKFYGNGDIIEQGISEYGIVAEDRIEDAFKEYMDQYIDDVVLHEIPKAYQSYFDSEKFTKDAIAGDGYGMMSPYDSNYYEITIGDKTWYVFRLN